MYRVKWVYIIGVTNAMNVFDVISKLISININLFDVTFRDMNMLVILHHHSFTISWISTTVQSDHIR